jgi:hypothetical protein
MSNEPSKSRGEQTSVERVDAPPTQTKTPRQLPPGFALAWLHLLPDSAFPIRSRDDMAVKISSLLLGRASSTEARGAALPAGAQPQPGETRSAH